MIGEKERDMFAEYEYDYDRIVEDTDDLDLYTDEYDYDDVDDEAEWENYYHNVAEEIDEWLSPQWTQLGGTSILL